MKEQIKQQLAALLEELSDWKGSWGEAPDDENPVLPDQAMGIGEFIKSCALELSEYEIVGMAEAVYQKGQATRR